jgi:hypothetical protein
MAVELATSIDPPMAWSTLHPINQSAPWAPSKGSNESRTDATVKTRKPAL